jgi:xylulose-5-phosphate/fructose-6-phosphate phosphoketolase
MAQPAPSDLDESSVDVLSDAQPLSAEELRLLDAYWRAANYLSVGQIYLLGNPLLREPLAPEHVKPRLLGHWGTTPGLNLLYVHLNRAIRRRDLDVIYICGPGHGGPGMVANAYLEGSYSELYPHVGEDEAGLSTLFRQFSFPGGIPSRAAPETPGSIHEGGELGYALRTHSGRRSRTRILWWHASSATARRRPARWRRAGTRTSS